MNKTLHLFGVLALSTFFVRSSSAAIVDVTVDRGSATTSIGSIVEIADTIAASTYPGLLSFTVSGLSIDSVGTADDSLSFELGVTGTGSGGIEGFGVNANAFGVNSTNPDDSSLIDVAGESLTLGLNSATISLGIGATEIGVVSFVGFTGVNISAITVGDSYVLSGGTGVDGTLTADPVFTLTPTSFTIAHNAGNGIRVEDIGARFNVSSVAVPEPTTAGLIGVGVVGWFARRRRS